MCTAQTHSRLLLTVVVVVVNVVNVVVVGVGGVVDANDGETSQHSWSPLDFLWYFLYQS